MPVLTCAFLAFVLGWPQDAKGIIPAWIHRGWCILQLSESVCCAVLLSPSRHFRQTLRDLAKLQASVQHALLDLGVRAEPLLSKLVALSQSLRRGLLGLQVQVCVAPPRSF